MTIAISLKVNDGLVLAADSASTLFSPGPTPGAPVVVNVYNNANKVFNLRKGLPIGAITWGSGSIGQASISTLVKDFRRRLTTECQGFEQWVLRPDTYTVEQVAQHLRTYIFDELYTPAFATWQDAQKPPLGFIVAGYSAGVSMAEEYLISIHGGQCAPPQLFRPREQVGALWNGEPEAISRLLLGHSPLLGGVLQELGVPQPQIVPALATIRQRLETFLVHAAMPIQDAIDLAAFLVDLTIQFSRFKPGAATVGGPIEIAAITKHEGFRWVSRKYYFSRELNPDEPGEPG